MSNTFCMESSDFAKATTDLEGNSKETNNNPPSPRLLRTGNNNAQQSAKWQKKEVPLSLAASCMLSIIENLDQYDLKELKNAKYPEQMINLFEVLKGEIENNEKLSPEEQRKKLDDQAAFFANSTNLVETFAYLANKFDEKSETKRNTFILNRVGWLKDKPAQIKEFYVKDLCSIAASSGNLNALKFIENYMDLNETFGVWTCLSMAASNNNLPTVQYLVSKGFTEDALNAFREAIANGHIEIVKYFYENNLVPKIKDWYKDWYPLATAAHARKNRLELVKYFIGKGANPDGLTKEWSSNPIANACSNFYQYPLDEKIKVIEFLLAAGADISKDEMLLYHLVMDGQAEILELLLPRGLSKFINEPIHGSPKLPLCRGCSEANLKIVKLLLDNGAKVNLQDEYKQTALYHALRSFKNTGIYIADLLISEGATIELSQIFELLEGMTSGFYTVINLDIFAYVIKLAEKIEGLESAKSRIRILADKAHKSEKNELAQYLYDLFNNNDLDPVLNFYNQKWILDNFFSDKP